MRAAHADVGAFSRGVMGRHALRGYQLGPARAIVAAVRQGGGRQFAVVFSRQSGKDEMLAQTLAYLLTLYRLRGGSIVVAAPTLRPQGALSRRRLLDRLEGNPLTRRGVRTEGNEVRLGRARCAFVSCAPGASARGETASLLLVCNEAQDVAPERWDAVFDPMAASTNATTVFMGTVWTARTLLARQTRYLRELEAADGERRVWEVGWERVARDVPAYGERVRARIAQLGRNHPFVKTEYFLEELGAEGGMFGAAVRERMRGSHPARRSPEPGKAYALLVDVGGEEAAGGESGEGQGERTPDSRPEAGEWGEVEACHSERSEESVVWSHGSFAGAQDDMTFAFHRTPYAAEPDTTSALLGSRRDATAVTVVEVDTAALTDPALLAPVYRVVARKAWTGAGQPRLLAELRELALHWGARRVVVDATGIGAGLAAFLRESLGPRVVIPFVFTTQSKSALGWSFLNLCAAGRFRDHAPDNSPEQALFWAQVEECEYETLPGPARRMRWGVAGRTHDDLLLSAALCSALDGVDWRARVARGRARDEAKG